MLNVAAKPIFKIRFRKFCTLIKTTIQRNCNWFPIHRWIFLLGFLYNEFTKISITHMFKIPFIRNLLFEIQRLSYFILIESAIEIRTYETILLLYSICGYRIKSWISMERMESKFEISTNNFSLRKPMLIALNYHIILSRIWINS